MLGSNCFRLFKLLSTVKVLCSLASSKLGYHPGPKHEVVDIPAKYYDRKVVDQYKVTALSTVHLEPTGVIATSHVEAKENREDYKIQEESHAH